ncbi:hypothetical protein Val02_52140 [Virgisporangium aliadipatigenens]|uniref:Nucleotide exchange factor GrpE n=1 Tax=Virgisporangium aliadipatigenens TaxID=741659 RepID=A0A8J4DSX3_9ACTN|nr:nucleotide exchange factor GrpE [Virgisporangium aliadipatigenens]GIJ48328.1 hypothetical protein Val02_52140 [Virgisporangium aliadipatigenens]
MNDHHTTDVANDQLPAEDVTAWIPVQPEADSPPEQVPTEKIEAVLAEIRDQLVAGNARAAAREQIIDRLHAENQRLRSGELALLLRPILTDLQRLRNELLAGAGDRQLSTRQVADLLGSYASSVELTLERGGVRVVRPELGLPFDPAAHRVVGIEPTGDRAADGTVAAVTADGYVDTATERVTLPATVRVYRWTEPVEPSRPEDPIEPDRG